MAIREGSKYTMKCFLAIQNYACKEFRVILYYIAKIDIKERGPKKKKTPQNLCMGKKLVFHLW